MKHITDDDLIDYLHHECTDALDARIHEHLGLCRDCRDRADAEARVGDWLRATAVTDERDFPSLIKANVWAEIHAAEPTLLDRVRRFMGPALALPVAAAIAVMMYFGVPIIRANGVPTPTVAAAYYFEEHAAEGLENPLADHVTSSATLAFETAPMGQRSPLIDAADAATLDDVAAARR
jgi:predicted anti-sigma-YlaC factor YlaD